MTTHTFPISPAESNLINQLSFVAFVLLIALLVYLMFDSKSIFSTLIALLVLPLLIYSLFANRITTFTVDSKYLSINRAIYGKRIELNRLDIANAQVLDLSQDNNKKFRPIIRTNGIGLPFYQAGWFRLRSKEKALLFVSNSKKVAYIPTTENYVLMLSVNNPEKLLASIRY